MKEESKKYAREAMDIVEHAAKKIGSRLPGSEGERKFHNYMADKLKEIGIKPVTEEFAVSPRSSIGGISYAGMYGLISSLLIFFALELKAVGYGLVDFQRVPLQNMVRYVLSTGNFSKYIR